MALCLGDYAEGDWYFIVVCKACGRETALEPAELLGPGRGRKKCIAECAWKTWRPSCTAENAAAGRRISNRLPEFASKISSAG